MGNGFSNSKTLRTDEQVNNSESSSAVRPITNELTATSTNNSTPSTEIPPATPVEATGNNNQVTPLETGETSSPPATGQGEGSSPKAPSRCSRSSLQSQCNVGSCKDLARTRKMRGEHMLRRQDQDREVQIERVMSRKRKIEASQPASKISSRTSTRLGQIKRAKAVSVRARPFGAYARFGKRHHVYTQTLRQNDIESISDSESTNSDSTEDVEVCEPPKKMRRRR